MAFSRPKKHGSVQVPAPAGGGGGGGLSSTDWERLHPIDGNTTQAVNWSSGTGSNPRNYDAPNPNGANTQSVIDSISDNGTFTTVTFSGASHSGNANNQNQMWCTCLWTWELKDIWGNAIDMTKPFHAKWMLEWHDGNAVGSSPYFPDYNRVWVAGGVTTRPALGWTGSPLASQQHPTTDSSHWVGLDVANSRHITRLKAGANRPYTSPKFFTKAGTGTTNKVVGTLMQGIDRIPILTGESWKNDAAKPSTPVYEFDQAGQLDVISDAHTQGGNNTTGYWILGVGRQGSSSNTAATTVKFSFHVNAVNIGTSWTP